MDAAWALLDVGLVVRGARRFGESELTAVLGCNGAKKTAALRIATIATGVTGKVDMSMNEWPIWPERQDLADEFKRLLVSAQDGGATVAETFLAASRIDFNNGGSWYDEWKRLARLNEERGQAALQNGQVSTARSNWLRAINYHQAAAFPFAPSDERYQTALECARTCSREYLRHRVAPGEVVEIPWLSDHPLEGYFLPAGALQRSPAVICIGEPGHRKEEFLFKADRHAINRGLSLLAVDLLGDRTGASLNDLIRRQDPETAIHHVMDYLVTRDDIDRDRIAIYADGWGSSFVARGIAGDSRFAGAVCDAGLWDMHERAFLAQRQHRTSVGSNFAKMPPIARRIVCPILVTVGEQGWLLAEKVTEMVGQLKGDGLDITLKIFVASETAAAQGHADNPTLASEYIFDWLATRLAHA
jgi:dienelactone hydrolase